MRKIGEDTVLFMVALFGLWLLFGVGYALFFWVVTSIIYP